MKKISLEQKRINKKIYGEKYRRENKDKIHKKNVEYWINHKEEIKGRHRKWRKTHAENIKISSKKYRLENPEKIYKCQKEWIKKNPERRKLIVKNSLARHPETRRNRIYGVDIVKVKKIQDNKCAICSKECLLMADHCHKTNKFRGLLCNDCNLGLGRFFDSVDILEKAKNYLLKNKIS